MRRGGGGEYLRCDDGRHVTGRDAHLPRDRLPGGLGSAVLDRQRDAPRPRTPALLVDATVGSVRDLCESRDLLANLTLRELRGKYKRSVLGWAWSLLNPLATMVIFSVVFGVFLKVQSRPGDPSGLDVFPLFLLCGLLPWNFLSNAMNGAMGTCSATPG